MMWQWESNTFQYLARPARVLVSSLLSDELIWEVTEGPGIACGTLLRLCSSSRL